jgi:hypothetical protein
LSSDQKSAEDDEEEEDEAAQVVEEPDEEEDQRHILADGENALKRLFFNVGLYNRIRTIKFKSY